MTSIQQAILGLVERLEASRAVVSPGSRNAAVITSLMNANYDLRSVIDERSAGFQALGMAKSLKQAVVLSCTSGTAALNYYPAIAEAFYARIPLIVITADRPAHYIDQWEGQAIRQQQVYSQHCRLSLHCDEHTTAEEFVGIAKQVNEYLEFGIKGPIHINIAIPEPFYLTDVLARKQETRQFVTSESIMLLDLDDYINVPESAQKVLVVNGMEDGQVMIVQCKEAESYEQLVVLSDITANQASSVLHWDAMLYSLMRNNPEKAQVLQPDVLITTGTITVSKGLKQLLRRYKPGKHFHISRHKEVGDPFGTQPIRIDPYSPVRGARKLSIDSNYGRFWQELSVQYVHQIVGFNWAEMNEFSAAKYVLSSLPASGVLHLANSTSVRYGSFLADELDAVEIQSNRGASGIDGCTSTALGAAVVCDQEVYLLTGDVAFLYDQNAFLSGPLPSNFKVIVLNNQGGRIFEYIDGPDQLKERLEYQVTAHNVPIEKVCEQYGLQYFCATTAEELEPQMNEFLAADKLALIEVRTDPAVNKKFFQQFKNISYE